MLEFRNLFIPLSLVILFLGCSKSENLILGDWVLIKRQYSALDKSAGFPKKIYSFGNDSIRIKSFQFEYDVFEKKNEYAKYIVKNDEIISNVFGYSKSSIEHISTSELKIRNDEYKLFFNKLNPYNQKQNFHKLKNLLVQHNWALKDSEIKLEFLSDGRYVSNTLYDFTSNWGYSVDSFKNEVFLVFSGFTGPVLQLKTYDLENLDFILYDEDNREINLFINKPQPIFKESDIFGTWQMKMRINDKDTITREYLDKYLGLPDQYNYRISDGKIERRWKKEIQSERTWELSKSGKIMIFNEPWLTEDKFQWNIIKLDEQSLTIEKRKRGSVPIEQVIFEKINENDM